MKRRFTILTAALALLTFLAVPMGMWGQTRTTVTDQMTHADLAATGSSYADFSNVSLESDAVYAGNSAREYANSQYNIQLRSRNSNSGIVTTTSGGNIVSITITVAHGTNTIDIYGKNTAYSSASDLYNANTQGTKIGSLSATGTINVTDSYAYVGIRSNNNAVYLSSIDFVWDEGDGSAVATTTSIDASNITNTDVYVSTTAGSFTATVTETESGDAISGATVIWSSSDTDVATIDNNGAVTLVAAGTTIITASYAGESDVYAISSATYELTVTSSEPYVQPTTIEIIPNYTFWGKSAQFSGTDFDELEGSKDNVTLNWTRGNGSTYANTQAMRFYKDNDLTFTAPEGYEIISIALTVTGTYSDLTFSPTGYNNETTTWTGAAETVTMSRPSNASSYATISKFTITLSLPSTNPSITADNVNIAYSATSGAITYSISNEPSPAGTLTATITEGNWLTLGQGTTSPIAFTCTANENTTARTATVTLTYTYGDNETVTKDVTITQAEAPVIYTTIPALFDAATSTATDVTVTFGGWVVSAVHNSNAYLTDNQGHGLIIYASEHGFQVNDVLTGTASCKLQTYRGSAELTNLTSSTEGLTVVNNGTVTEQNIDISELGGVNTGALLAYQGLTYDGTALVDGNNNTITPYNTLYSYTFENGKTYNVKGVYLQYNSTKEILPRSADDIEEVTAPVSEYTLTVTTSANVEIFTFVGETTDPGVEGSTTLQVNNGTEVGISVSADEGYILTLVVDGIDVTSQLDETGYYTFTMPTHDVTVSATATAAPVVTTSTYTLATSIESGKQYIIVGQADGDYYAMGEDRSNNRGAYVITVNGTKATVLSTDVHEFTISSLATEGFYSICDATVPGYLYAASSSKNYLKTESELDSDGNGDWEITFNTGGNVDVVASNSEFSRNIMRFNNQSTIFSCYSSGQHPVYLYVKDETPVTETYTKDIIAYTGNTDHYYLIASPITEDVTPSATNGFLTSAYDLYYFNQDGDSEGLEWINYEDENDGGYSIENGKGYLYASSTNTSLLFTGTPYSGNGEVNLTYSTANADATMHGWNLVGNPFAQTAYIDMPFYTLDGESEYQEHAAGEAINRMQGVLVHTSETKTLTFSTTPINKSAKLAVNVTKDRSVIDRAIVNFSEGSQLPKFQLNPNHTKVYMPVDGKDYAVANAENEGEMPVNFKAEKNGTYTLSFTSEEVSFSYLHLIDNMNGADIDLLATPSYSFEARTTDYANRFKLSFKANTGVEENATSTFAYYNGSAWNISNMGEAILQVVDMMGRVLSSETISGNVSISLNQPAGVYMLRLVNGENVMVQKVVVR